MIYRLNAGSRFLLNLLTLVHLHSKLRGFSQRPWEPIKIHSQSGDKLDFAINFWVCVWPLWFRHIVRIEPHFRLRATPRLQKNWPVAFEIHRILNHTKFSISINRYSLLQHEMHNLIENTMSFTNLLWFFLHSKCQN